MTLGKNTIESTRLREIVDQIEVINSEIKDLQERRTAVFANARSEGFTLAGIRYVVKARAMKPHDRQEAEAIRDTYMHAMGMDDEPPLYRVVQAMAEDELGREKLIENLKAMCPPLGDFIMRVGGAPMRIFRDLAGTAHAEPYVESEAKAPPSKKAASKPQREVPDVDDAGALEYGRELYRQNRPITENPFPYGDPRRAKCDEGYRLESGSDGMGDRED